MDSWIEIFYKSGFKQIGCVYEHGHIIEHSTEREKVLEVVGRVVLDGYNVEVINRGCFNYTVIIK